MNNLNNNQQQWSSNASGIKRENAPIPLNFNIPEGATTGIIPGLTIPDSFTARFQMNPPLVVPENACCDLTVASFPYSVPNIAGIGELPAISNGNDRISINWNAGGFQDYTIPTGLYSYLDVQYALNQIAVTQGWILPGEQLFTLVGVQATQTIDLIVTPTASMGTFPAGGIVLSFVNPSPATGNNNSMGNILGFGVTSPAAVLTISGGGSSPVSFAAPNVADFAEINAYLLYVSTVKDSYSNGLTGQLLFAFPLGDYAPNTVAKYQSTQRYPVPANPGNYSQVSIYLTDNFGNKIPLKFFQGAITFSFVLSRNKHDGSI
jgi:hypothetical protein